MRTNRLSRMIRDVGFGVFFLFTAIAGAVEIGWTETWSGTNAESWSCYDLVNEKVQAKVSLDAGALKLAFAAQAMKTPPEEYMIRATELASGGRFIGDYVSNAVTAISLRLYCEYPVAAKVVLWNRHTHRLWQYPIPGLVSGQWQQVVAPVDPGILGIVGKSNNWATFHEDLRSVTWAGVLITRNPGMQTQVYRIDDFKLLGVGPEYAAWAQEYMGDATNTLPSGNADGDRFSNYQEFERGTDPLDPHLPANLHWIPLLLDP